MSFALDELDLPPAFSPRDPNTNHHSLPPPPHEASATVHENNTDPAPSYDLPFDQLYLQFKSADEAAVQTLSLGLSYIENYTKLHAKLSKASKDFERQRKINSALFVRLHGKKNKLLSQVLPFSRIKKANAKRASEVMQSNNSVDSNATRSPLGDFQTAYNDETTKAAEIEHLKSQITALENQRLVQLSVISALDDAWQRLRRAGTGVSQKVTTDFNRSRVFIQHAHHYFSQTIRASNALEPAHIDRSIVGGIGPTNKFNDYKDAVVMGGKAQVCLNESLRVMKSYLYLFPGDRKADYKALQMLGLMQISDIYNLVYGGRLILSSRQKVSQAIQKFLDQQDRALKHLTALAVWVQDRGPVCEKDERTAEERRMGTRRELAGLWMQCR